MKREDILVIGLLGFSKLERGGFRQLLVILNSQFPQKMMRDECELECGNSCWAFPKNNLLYTLSSNKIYIIRTVCDLESRQNINYII